MPGCVGSVSDRGNSGELRRHVLPPNAVARANAERLDYVQIIVGELWIAKEPFGVKFFWLGEVSSAVIGGKLPYGHSTLQQV